MRVLVDNLITAVSATSENPEYPAVNLLDQHPKKYAEGGDGTTVTYTLTVNGAGNWFGIVGTNARKVTVKIYSSLLDEEGNAPVLWDDTELWDDDADWVEDGPIFEKEYSLSGIDTYAELIRGEGQSLYVLDIDYTYQVAPHSIVIELDTMEPGVAPHLGCAVAGTAVESGYDISLGLKEGLKDYSIVRQLSNGAEYVLDRDKVRTFSGTLNLTRDREFYDFLYGVYRTIGRNPRLFRITGMANHDWVVFARLDGDITGTHHHIDMSQLPLNLVEVL